MIKNPLVSATLMALVLFTESALSVSAPPASWAGFYAGLNAGGIGVFDSGSVFYPGEFIESSLITSKRTNYFGTLRGKLGVLATPVLVIHGNGGLAYGGVSSWTTITQTNNDSTFYPSQLSLIPKTYNY